MKRNEEPIVVVQKFDVSTDRLWAAITRLEEMKRWFFDNILAFQPTVGFETRFDIESGERVFPHLWKIIEVIPNKKIVYDWKYDGYPGVAQVTFELKETKGGTQLTLTSIALEDFSDDIPEFKRESGEQGWTYLIKQSLKEYLD